VGGRRRRRWELPVKVYFNRVTVKLFKSVINKSIINLCSGPSNRITSGSTRGRGNNLTGIDDNVRERGLEQKCFQTLTDGRQRRSRDHIVRTRFQMVGPATGN